MDATPHIMVVDDDREIRDLLARFLERHRIRVTAVRDGREARRAWTNGHFQLVVLDLRLRRVCIWRRDTLRRRQFHSRRHQNVMS